MNANFDRNRPCLVEPRAKFGRNLTTFGRTRPQLGKTRQKDDSWSKSGQTSSTPTNHWPYDFTNSQIARSLHQLGARAAFQPRAAGINRDCMCTFAVPPPPPLMACRMEAMARRANAQRRDASCRQPAQTSRAMHSGQARTNARTAAPQRSRPKTPRRLRHTRSWDWLSNSRKRCGRLVDTDAAQQQASIPV